MALAVVAGGLLVGFGWWVVFRPTSDPLPSTPADALVVLGPLEPWRVPEAQALMRRGAARNLVISTPVLPEDAQHCHQGSPWPVYCVAPRPTTTRGEATGYRELAARHGWRSVVVLTLDFHAGRARFIFRRCLPASQVSVVGERQFSYSGGRRQQIPYQVAAFAKELWLGPC